MVMGPRSVSMVDMSKEQMCEDIVWTYGIGITENNNVHKIAVL